MDHNTRPNKRARTRADVTAAAGAGGGHSAAGGDFREQTRAARHTIANIAASLASAAGAGTASGMASSAPRSDPSTWTDAHRGGPAIHRDLSAVSAAGELMAPPDDEDGAGESDLDANDMTHELDKALGMRTPGQRASKKRTQSKGKGKGKGKRKGKAKQKVIPPELRAILGEAEEAYMDQEYDLAVQKCKEFVKLNPDYSEPYSLLGTALEQQGNLEDARKAYGWGAHADRSDKTMVMNWGRLSFTLANEGNNYMEEARIAFGRAFKLDPSDVDAAADYARCLTETGRHEQASEVYTKLIDTSRGTRVRPSLVYPMLAQSLHAQGKLKEAEKRLRKCLDLCFGVDGDPEEDYDTVEMQWRKEDGLTTTNMLAELLQTQKRHEDTVQVAERCIMFFQHHNQDRHDIPLDIWVKYGISQTYCHNVTEANAALEQLRSTSVEHVVDLYYAVAVAFSENSRCGEALDLIAAVQAANPAYNCADVWLIQGKCYAELQSFDDAIRLYTQVREEDAENMEALDGLLRVYTLKGSVDEAVRLVNTSNLQSNMDKLIKVCFIMKNANRQRQYLKHAKQLMFAKRNRHAEIRLLRVMGCDMYMATLNDVARSMVDQFKGAEAVRLLTNLIQRLNTPTSVRMLTSGSHRRARAPSAGSDDLSDDSDVGDHASHASGANGVPTTRAGRRAAKRTLLIEAVTRLLSLYHMVLRQCVRREDYDAALEALRHVTFKVGSPAFVWNLLTAVTAKTQGFPLFVQKMLVREHYKMPSDVRVMLCLAHHTMRSRVHNFAAGLIYHTMRLQPSGSHPLLSLTLAVVFLNKGRLQHVKTNVANQNKRLMKGLAYINDYQAARLAMVPEGRDVEPVSSQVLTHGALQSVPWHLSMEARERVPRYLIQQEVEYNLGRALCHVGLPSLALPVYQRVLDIPVPVERPAWEARLDLRREAAYNMVEIYVAGGCEAQARELVAEYLTEEDDWDDGAESDDAGDWDGAVDAAQSPWPAGAHYEAPPTPSGSGGHVARAPPRVGATAAVQVSIAPSP